MSPFPDRARDLSSFAVLTAAALSLGACSKAADEQRAPGQTNEPVNVAQDAAGAATGLATAATAAVSTEAFVRDAAIGDMYEIESAKMALVRSKNAQVRKTAGGDAWAEADSA